MRGFIHFPLIYTVVFLSLMFVAQRFWFVRAWRLIDAIAWPACDTCFKVFGAPLSCSC